MSYNVQVLNYSSDMCPFTIFLPYAVRDLETDLRLLDSGGGSSFQCAGAVLLDR